MLIYFPFRAKSALYVSQNKTAKDNTAPTLDTQSDLHSFVLDPVDQLTAVASVVLQLQVGDAEGGVQRVGPPQRGPGPQRSVVLLSVAVGDEHDVLHSLVVGLQFHPFDSVVGGLALQHARQRGVPPTRGRDLGVHGRLHEVAQLLLT